MPNWSLFAPLANVSNLEQSLHSHASKAHFHSPAESAVRCHLCPVVCNSKSGIKRHLRVTHRTDQLPPEGFTYKCK